MRKILRTKGRIYRGKRRFHYHYDNGVKVEDKDILKTIEKLRIPPAWVDVVINLSKTVNRVAVGTDEAGRKQSIYNKKFVLKNRKERMCNIADLILVLPNIRKSINADIKSNSRYEKAVATIIKMMDTCCPLRIGNEKYRKLYKTYGLSTLERRHLSIKRDKIIIEFVGKKHMVNKKVITRRDNRAVYDSLVYFHKTAVRVRDSGKYRTPIFSYCSKLITSCDINDYLAKYGKFSAKDFRTLRANVELLKGLGIEGIPNNKTDMARKRNNALDKACEVLNNTRAICKSNYVLKPILTLYETKPKSLMMKISRSTNMESVLHELLMDCSKKRAINF